MEGYEKQLGHRPVKPFAESGLSGQEARTFTPKRPCTMLKHLGGHETFLDVPVRHREASSFLVNDNVQPVLQTYIPPRELHWTCSGTSSGRGRSWNFRRN